jgi:starch synthase
MSERFRPVTNESEPTIALLPWGDRFEDFFDTIGVSFETFREEITGSWQFGYIDALRVAGVRTVLFYVSARVAAPLRFTHKPSGATVCVLPAPVIHRAVRAIHRKFIAGQLKSLESLASYLATPLGLLARELRREGCAAILCQEYEYARFDACVLLGQLMGLPIFATFQGGTSK